MAQLAIKGNPTRGKEVIEILGMLGGSNAFNHIGNNTRAIYYIDENYKNFITCSETKKICDCIIFALEEFIEKFPYKVGDKVLYYGNLVFITQMEWIEDSVSYHFYYKGKELMLPSKHLQPYKEETMEKQKKDYD